MCFFDKKGNPDALPSPLIIGGILLYYVFSFGVFFITLIFLPEWKLESKKNHIEYNNFETEENLKKFPIMELKM